ncbi:unannotated protein [freshwater metagenome]|uniref:Unannotated protein n=1 Tax=freshwater metagenome TaxID=449393 RepID=A0A6J6YJ98_9ZZZZ
MFGDECEEPSQLIPLLAQAGVQQGLVPFASAPENVVLTIKAVRCFKSVTNLRSGIGEHFWVRVRRCASGVARMRKQVGGSPKQAHATLFHLEPSAIHHEVKVGAGLPKCVACWRHIEVMKAEKRCAKFCEELKRCILFCAGCLGSVGRCIKPRSVKSAYAKDVAAGPTKAVPVTHRNAQVILHALAGHQSVRVIDPIAQAV